MSTPLVASPTFDRSPAALRDWQRGLLLSLLIFAATRLLVWSSAYSGAALRVAIRADIDPPLAWRQTEVSEALRDADSALSRTVREQMGDFAPLMRWDAGHYEWIIREGYRYEPRPDAPPEANQWNIAFFPLYPILCSGLAPWLGVHGAMAAVANLSGLAAVAALYAFCCPRIGRGGAIWSVALLSCWPTSAFLSFGYPESLALALAVLALTLADREKWLWAALLCGLATATRPTLVMLAPLLMWAYARRSGSAPRPALAAVAAFGVVCVWGAAAYAGYLTWRFGTPWVYLSNFQQGWLAGRGIDWRNYVLFSTLADGFRYFGRAIEGFPLGLVYLANPITWNVPLTLALLGLSLAGLRGVVRDFRPYLWLAPLIFLQRYAVSGWSGFATESMARYVGLAAPTFVVLGAWVAREWSAGARAALIAVLLLLQSMWAVNFGLSEWAG